MPYELLFIAHDARKTHSLTALDGLIAKDLIHLVNEYLSFQAGALSYQEKADALLIMFNPLFELERVPDKKKESFQSKIISRHLKVSKELYIKLYPHRKVFSRDETPFNEVKDLLITCRNENKAPDPHSSVGMLSYRLLPLYGTLKNEANYILMELKKSQKTYLDVVKTLELMRQFFLHFDDFLNGINFDDFVSKINSYKELMPVEALNKLLAIQNASQHDDAKLCQNESMSAKTFISQLEEKCVTESKQEIQKSKLNVSEEFVQCLQRVYSITDLNEIEAYFNIRTNKVPAFINRHRNTAKKVFHSETTFSYDCVLEQIKLRQSDLNLMNQSLDKSTIFTVANSLSNSSSSASLSSNSSCFSSSRDLYTNQM